MLKRNIKEAPVTLSAVLGEAILSFADVLTLEVGDVIRLNSHSDDPISVRVNDLEKFKGVPGVHRGHYAVKITEVVETEVE